MYLQILYFDNFPTYETRFDSASLNNKFDVDLSASIITSSTDVYTKCCIIIGDEINKSSIQIVEISNNKFTFNFTQDNYNDIVKSRDSGNWRWDKYHAVWGTTRFENPSFFGWDDYEKAPDCPRFHFNFKQAIIKSDKSYAANSVYKENYINEKVMYEKNKSYGKPLNILHNNENLRQEHRPFFIRNGSIYITKIKFFIKYKKIISKNPILYIMNKINSVNIDTKDDLEILKKLI